MSAPETVMLHRGRFERGIRWLRHVALSIAEECGPTADLIEDCADTLEESKIERPEHNGTG